MSFYAVLDDSLTAFAGLALEPCLLPDEFTTQLRQKDHGPQQLTNRFFRVDERGEVRSVLITAPKIAIITLFFFPDPQWDLPVYALELVMFGTRPIVGVLDGLCLVPSMASEPPLIEHWRSARARCHLPQQTDDVPDWYRACRSGHDFFVRPTKTDTFAPLILAHQSLWKTLATWIAQAQAMPRQRVGPHRDALGAYKRHHAAHFPGRSFLKQGFGENWTERYLKEILFK
ncbi:hypothetical protein [Methylomagnum sp.]